MSGHRVERDDALDLFVQREGCGELTGPASVLQGSCGGVGPGVRFSVLEIERVFVGPLVIDLGLVVDRADATRFLDGRKLDVIDEGFGLLSSAKGHLKFKGLRWAGHKNRGPVEVNHLNRHVDVEVQLLHTGFEVRVGVKALRPRFRFEPLLDRLFDLLVDLFKRNGCGRVRADFCRDVAAVVIMYRISRNVAVCAWRSQEMAQVFATAHASEGRHRVRQAKERTFCQCQIRVTRKRRVVFGRRLRWKGRIRIGLVEQLFVVIGQCVGRGLDQ